MKKSFQFLLVLLGMAFSPLTTRGAAGYLYESDTSTGSIFQFTTTASGTLVKTTFASGLTGLRGIAFDRAGNLFAAQEETILRITPAGFKSVFASGLHGPNFLAFDPAGNLYASDRDGNVLRITPQGAKSVFVSDLEKPTGLAFDTAGNLFVADFMANKIYKITPAGGKSTFAFGLNGPQGMTFDRFGSLYVANSGSNTVEAFTPVGSRFTVIFNIASPISLTFASRPRTNANVDTRDDLYVALNCSGTSTGTGSIRKFTSTSETGELFASDVGCPMQLAFEPPRDPLLNISTRAHVETGQNRELIGGFIITGTAPKTVLLRAIGPSLAKLNPPVPDPLPDPTLELHRPDGSTTSNNDWMDTQKEEIQATGLAPKDNHESAILVSLDPGNYTAIVRGSPPTEDGIALVEVYDLDLAAPSTVANISSRGYVGTGNDVMIAGFIIGGGNGAGEVIIRALGPSLTEAGVTRVLPDPVLSIHDANGERISNDDWADAQAIEIEATGIAPSSSLESAIVTTLTNGAYTAVVRDLNNASGVGLVEVYNLR
jgi:sugar lactone lactonase YvrE